MKTMRSSVSPASAATSHVNDVNFVRLPVPVPPRFAENFSGLVIRKEDLHVAGGRAHGALERVAAGEIHVLIYEEAAEILRFHIRFAVALIREERDAAVIIGIDGFLLEEARSTRERFCLQSPRRR